jgi:hypothetical protein
MTQPKNSVSRNRYGKWDGALATPVRIPRDATPEQELEAAAEIDRRMTLLAERYGINLNGPGGWMVLAYSLAADTVPGIAVERKGANESATLKTPEYWRDAAMALQWARRTIGNHGASSAAALFLATQMKDDNLPLTQRARQIANDLSTIPDDVLNWARDVVARFFSSHPDLDDKFS